jgi:hypothetical protein
MIFDECTPYPADKVTAEQSMQLSLRWAQRSKDTHQALGNENALFGIVQGGMYAAQLPPPKHWVCLPPLNIGAYPLAVVRVENPTLVTGTYVCLHLL